MSLDNQQAAFLSDYRRAFTSLATAIHNLNEMRDIYFDRGYGSGGANEIQDADLLGDNADISASTIASGITVAEQLVNFRDNAAVATGDYGATINKLRNL